ncbi:hypothetical protein ACIA8K_37135 [Catenuloplanes sp. NPDC051500]|uniref:hypothetical protein n=1 Tax=Catenuloplanes sp. NPDC051500 TaxID=3363959 RepID=UPI003790F109
MVEVVEVVEVVKVVKGRFHGPARCVAPERSVIQRAAAALTLPPKVGSKWPGQKP